MISGDVFCCYVRKETVVRTCLDFTHPAVYKVCHIFILYCKCVKTQVEDQPITTGYFCFLPGEIFIQLLCLSLLFFVLYFHLVAPWNWFLSACLLPLWATYRLGRGKRERWKALFFLQGGFHTPPSKEAFRAHPFRFLDENRENMWAQMHQVWSGWVSWRMLRRRVAFNPQNQFTSRKLLHRTKW